MLDRSPVALISSRASVFVRQAAAVTVCALAAHAVAYGSLMPHGGGHGYFGWYAPLVAALSVVALVGTVLALAIALAAGSGSRATSALRSILPARPAEGSFVAGLFRLASAALVFLAVQESLERSLTANRLELVSFTPSTLAVLVATVVLAASVTVLIQRIASSLADLALQVACARPEHPSSSRWNRVLAADRPRRPLAVHGGLRAPPLLS